MYSVDKQDKHSKVSINFNGGALEINIGWVEGHLANCVAGFLPVRDTERTQLISFSRQDSWGGYESR
jgi:hypothetical protein